MKAVVSWMCVLVSEGGGVFSLCHVSAKDSGMKEDADGVMTKTLPRSAQPSSTLMEARHHNSRREPCMGASHAIKSFEPCGAEPRAHSEAYAL